MQSLASAHNNSERQLRVAIATSDASLVQRFSDSFEARVVRLEEAVSAPEHLSCQVILLDVRAQHCHLPAARLATNATVAVVVIARPDDTIEAMRYLDLGATDVLWSSMSTPEMQARVRAAARYVSDVQDDWVTIDRLAISLQRQEVRRDGEVVHLTPTEFRVLETLLLGGPSAVTHHSIMARVWGQEFVTARHYLRVYIRQLREKLEVDPSKPRFILTVPGEGYSLVAPTNSAGVRLHTA